MPQRSSLGRAADRPRPHRALAKLVVEAHASLDDAGPAADAGGEYSGPGLPWESTPRTMFKAPSVGSVASSAVSSPEPPPSLCSEGTPRAATRAVERLLAEKLAGRLRSRQGYTDLRRWFTAAWSGAQPTDYKATNGSATDG